MIYLNLTTKKKKRGKITPPRMEKNYCLLLFLFGTLVDFLCSSRGFVYLSFFYIFPLSRMLFFSPAFSIFKYQIPRSRFITSFDICIRALFKKPMAFSDETDIHLFCVFCYLFFLCSEISPKKDKKI